MPENNSYPKTSFLQKIGLITLGIFTTIILLEIILRLGGMYILWQQDIRNQSNRSSENTYTILFLGESTTMWGYENSYPRQVEKILNAKTDKIRFKVINKGISGTTTTQILKNLDKYIKEYNPDMIVSMMGINDKIDTVPYYGKDSDSNISFFQDLRVIKLVRLLREHIKSKLKEISPENKASANFLYFVDKANEAIRQKEYRKAQEYLIKAINASPSKLRGYMYLADFLISQKRYEEFEKILKSIIKKHANPYMAYTYLSAFYAKKKITIKQ